MITNHGSIALTAPGDVRSVDRPVIAVPSGLTLASVSMGVKTRRADPALVPGLPLKTITPVFVAGAGQITNTGAGGTGEFRLDYTATETALLKAGLAYWYFITATTSDGQTATIETGIWPMASGTALG